MSLEISIKTFIKEHNQMVTSGRAIARIFHGISSPQYPSNEWSRNKHWNSFKFYDFKDLYRIANKAMMDFKSRRK